MSNIRVTYSGYIGFIVGMISVITGLIFTLIVTRRLTPEEFGVWALIGSMISYFLVVEPIISYWTTRQIARGGSVGITSLISATIFSLGQIPIYLSLIFFLPFVSSEHYYSMIVGGILLPVTFVSQTLVGINQGHNPHATSYSLLAFESLKIPAGIFFVVLFNLGVDGAIFATFIAYVGKLIIQLHFAKSQLKKPFKIFLLKQWLKNSWLPLYVSISNFIWSLDIIIFSIITNSVITVGYYSISVTITALISHAGMISQALYPKLLARGNFLHIEENFIRFMYFVIPLLGIVIIFSKPALFALNPLYDHLSIPVILLSLRGFFYVLTSFFFQVLLGIEKVDEEQNPSFKSLIKSKLFHLPTVNIIHHSLYIILLAVITIMLTNQNASDLELVVAWTSVSLFLSIPIFVYVFYLLKKHVIFSIQHIELFKYTIGTFGMIIVFIITSNYLISYEISIYNFLPGVITEFILCICTYLGITYLIDNKTRILFKAILLEFTSNK